MGGYYHSVTLDKDKCKGCTNCIKRCPTEAIRVREGKARIIAERCIDCGECIRVCPYHAKIAVTDPLSSIYKFTYRIALPAPALYGQFKDVSDIDYILSALKSLGFNHVYEVAKGADYNTAFVKEWLKNKGIKKPQISSACPAIVRLIQVRFPELIENIVPIESPMEIAAQLARQEFYQKFGAREEDIGVFFITPCAAKMTSIKKPIGKEKSTVDGAISILDIYGALNSKIGDLQEIEGLQRASAYGVGWANSSGECAALSVERYLAVDGIQNVIHVLEEIENNKFPDLDFFEGLACVGGCVGGPLTFENGFVAKNRIKTLTDEMDKYSLTQNEFNAAKNSIRWEFTEDIQPKPVMKLDDDLTLAVQKMEKMERIFNSLPGLDCGSCGSPNCRTLAEDIVQGEASELDCVFKLRERVKELAEEMIELAEKIPTGRHGEDDSK